MFWAWWMQREFQVLYVILKMELKLPLRVAEQRQLPLGVAAPSTGGAPAAHGSSGNCAFSRALRHPSSDSVGDTAQPAPAAGVSRSPHGGQLGGMGLL